jgi:hypothetical protein
MSRDIRRLLHTKEGGRYFMKGHPGRVIREGEEILSIPVNKPLTIYRKQNGTVWELPFSSNGNQTVLRNLKVKGNHHIDKNLTINNDLTIDGEIKGSRAVFNFGEATGSSSATWYMDTVNGVTMSTTRGYVMHRPGSVVGASVQCNCTNDAGTATMIITVLLNGSILVQTSSTSVTSTGVWSNYEKFGRNTYSFTAGQFISIAISRTGASSTNDDAIGYFEVIFDD